MMKKIFLTLITLSIITMTSVTAFAASDVSVFKDGNEYTPIRYSFTNYGVWSEDGYCSRIEYVPQGEETSINGKPTVLDSDLISISVTEPHMKGRGVRLQWYPDGTIKVLGYEINLTKDNEGIDTSETGMPVDIGYFLKNYDNKIFVAVPDPINGGGRVFVTEKIVQEIERFLYPQQDDNTYNEAYSEARLQFLAEMRSSIYSNLNK